MFREIVNSLTSKFTNLAVQIQIKKINAETMFAEIQ